VVVSGLKRPASRFKSCPSHHHLERQKNVTQTRHAFWHFFPVPAFSCATGVITLVLVRRHEEIDNMERPDVCDSTSLMQAGCLERTHRIILLLQHLLTRYRRRAWRSLEQAIPHKEPARPYRRHLQVFIDPPSFPCPRRCSLTCPHEVTELVMAFAADPEKISFGSSVSQYEKLTPTPSPAPACSHRSSGSKDIGG
jgi:hypothetical protein